MKITALTINNSKIRKIIHTDLLLRCHLCCCRKFLCKERGDGALARAFSLQVTKTHIQQGQMERLTCVHHFMK